MTLCVIHIAPSPGRSCLPVPQASPLPTAFRGAKSNAQSLGRYSSTFSFPLVSDCGFLSLPCPRASPPGLFSQEQQVDLLRLLYLARGGASGNRNCAGHSLCRRARKSIGGNSLEAASIWLFSSSRDTCGNTDTQGSILILGSPGTHCQRREGSITLVLASATSFLRLSHISSRMLEAISVAVSCCSWRKPDGDANAGTKVSFVYT